MRGNGNSTSGHALLIRLKVAAALALLDQRTGVDDDDWELAGLVMAHSDQVRERMAAHMAAARRQENAASGRAAAYRAAIVEDTLAERAVRRACDWLRRRLPNLCDEEGWVAHVVLLRSATSRDRQHLAATLELLTQSGEVESSEAARTASGHGGRGVRYRLRTAKP